jgi:S1-C subfamily serine protease
VASAKLFDSIRLKLWIAAACLIVLLLGVLTLPPAPASPAAPTVAPVEERPAPLLDQEVQRREQVRLFSELQQLGPRLARHSVTIPAPEGPPPLPSDLTPPTPRLELAGHGLILSSDGDVLTTADALHGRELLPIVLVTGQQVTAYVVAFDPDTDLVLLHAEGLRLLEPPPLAPTPPAAGLLTVAVSHTSGEPAVTPVFITSGAPSGGRIRTTVAQLLPGTPIFTVDGDAIAIAAGGADASAILASPGVTSLRERIARGQSRRAVLGLSFDGNGIAELIANGPADAAGLQVGDVLTAIGDTEIASAEEALAAIAALTPATPVPVRVVRGRKTITIEVTPTSALSLRTRITGRRDDRAPRPEGSQR